MSGLELIPRASGWKLAARVGDDGRTGVLYCWISISGVSPVLYLET